MPWAYCQIRRNAGCACAGNTGNVFSDPWVSVSDPGMHHDTCVAHVPWCMPGSLTSGFVWNWWRGKRSRHSWRIHNPQFYVSGQRRIKNVNYQWRFLFELFCTWYGGQILIESWLDFLSIVFTLFMPEYRCLIWTCILLMNSKLRGISQNIYKLNI